jgi:hypothetical protein
MNTYPNFFIIGAHKSATTTLHEILSEIPGICMSNVKEPRYFALKDDKLNYNGINDPSAVCEYQNIETYLSLFANTENAQAIGESSTLYLYDERAPQNIHEAVPDAKIIAVLRDPVKRAFSNYNYGVMLGREPIKTFSKALDKEDERIQKNWGPFWHYKNKGLYGKQLSRYFALFKNTNIKIVFYEDLIANYESEVRSVLDFLGIFSNNFEIKKHKSNETLVPKSKIMRFILENKQFAKNLFPKKLRIKVKNFLFNKQKDSLFEKPKQIQPEEIEYLREFFIEDRTILESLLGKKITHWL